MKCAQFYPNIPYRFSSHMHINVPSFVGICHSISSLRQLVEVKLPPNLEWQRNEINTEKEEQILANKHEEDEVCVLGFKACALLIQVCSSLNELRNLHARILISGLGQNIVLGAKLVNLYCQYGDLEVARHLFDKMPERNIFLWNAIIKGYARNNLWQETLELYFQMRASGIAPDCLTFPFVIRACGGLCSLQWGRKIHYEVWRYGFGFDVYVGNALIDMYGKCGSVMGACQVFEKLPQRDVVSWTTMIAVFARNGQPNDALAVFVSMLWSDVRPNLVTIVNVLPACANLRDVCVGELIHNSVVVNGFESDVFIGTALVDMYAKCGSIENARCVFDHMFERNIVTWTAMITGYVQNGYGEEALALFHEMVMLKLNPDSVTIMNVMLACTDLGDLDQGKWIHDYVIQNRLKLDFDVVNFLVAMYVKCGNLQVAHELFAGLEKRTLVSCNAMIAGHAQNCHIKEAMKVFHEMQLANVKSNSSTLVSLLSACDFLRDLRQVMCIHNYIIRSGFESNVFVGTALIDVYCKCGSIESARRVFDIMCEKNVVSWSAMIAGYAQNGHANDALTLFHEMKLSNVAPNIATMVSLLPAYSNLVNLEQCRSIHGYIIRSGFESHISVGTALLGIYAKCGDIEVAGQLFDYMSRRDVVSWNAMIAGFAQNGHATKALSLFHEMQLADVQPSSVTMTCVLPACANLAALEQGRWIHDYIIRSGFESNISVVTALVDMYIKCGTIGFAQELFDKIKEKDVVVWNTMIAGYGTHGNSKDALDLFQQMQLTCIKPDHITFVCVLSACTHGGLVNEGWQYFKCMSQDYGINPRMEHYTCMVDLLGRAGQLNEAHTFINNMPLQPDSRVWGALLGACRIHSNIQLGELAAEHLFQLEPENSAHYVLLSNIYAAVGRWDGMTKVRRMIRNRRLKKSPGYSSIEVNCKVHVFIVED